MLLGYLYTSIYFRYKLPHSVVGINACGKSHLRKLRDYSRGGCRKRFRFK